MKFLVFKIKICFLKIYYSYYKKYDNKYRIKKEDKEKYIKYFIQDEEDKILNKKVLEEFDNKIIKYKNKKYKLRRKLDKILFQLGICDINYIEVFYDKNLSIKVRKIIKEILKEKIYEKKH